MRVHLNGDEAAEQFSQQLLEVGNGTYPTLNDKQVNLEFANKVTTLNDLIDSVFPDAQVNHLDPNWLRERAILAPKNCAVDDINEELLKRLPGQPTVHASIDTVCESDEAVNYPTEFLNSLQLPGLPPHLLKLKLGAPIMLLRNLKPPSMCNGTRLTVQQIMPNVIEALIITGKSKGSTVFIPKIPLIPSDTPFNFKRLQFPIKLSFAMTINKSQGQSLNVVGLNLIEPVFSHGQLYVGCSRVGNPNHLCILSPDGHTKNVVYKEALKN